MTTHHRLPTLLLLVVGLVMTSVRPPLRAAEEPLAARLSDSEFWRLTEALSEPNGYFRSDNLLSNEIYFQNVIPELVQRTEPGGIYIGVGPEQNFTYIAAIKPKMVFIPDIRRGNLQLQLVYKAVFELSADRADFVSRLFSRKRPAGLSAASTADEIFTAFAGVQPVDEAAYAQNLTAVEDHLTKTHAFALSADDRAGLDYVYGNFRRFGPDINYNSSTRGGGFGGFVSYADLMMASDMAKKNWGFLANEQTFATVKGLEEKNLVVPLVGDLAGPKAIRAIGQYARDHGATVAAFYASNVEQFLYEGGTWPNFCRNIASLPLDAKSTFIRSARRGGFARGLVTELGAMKSETENCSVPAR